MLRIARTTGIPAQFRGTARFLSSFYRLFPKTLPNGPPPKGKFDIDIKQLRTEYLNAQRHAHPDVSEDGNQVSSAELGTAFRVLKDPLTRAEHILDLRGENPLQEGAPSLDDEDLLMEIMMSREHVSEAESAEELQPVLDKANAKIQELVNAMAKALESDDIEFAKKTVVELTYLYKLRQAADEKLEGLK